MYNTPTTALLRNTFSNDIPIVFNVNFLIINNNNPASVPFYEDKILKKISRLNHNFNEFNIFYKYKGFSFIDINFVGSDFISKMSQIRNLPEYLDNSINIIIFNIILGAANFEHQEVVISREDIFSQVPHLPSKTTLTHEIGHLAGLFHTFHLTGGSPIPTDIDIVAENVTRDITNPNYNANIAGDLVIDTPAQFQGCENNYFEGITDAVGVGYHYISHQSIVDQANEVYDYIELQNFMSYFHDRSHFTNGQGVRMREIIENNPATFNRVKTNVASLYKPYKVETIETISTDIHSLSDNGDGTAEVCRLKSFTLNHYFQPGFDYDFFQGSNLTQHIDKDDLYSILDEGILKSVKINQIDPSFLTNEFDDYITNYSNIENGIVFYEPTACMRPVDDCVTEPYSGGRVISTTDLANPNSSVKVLNNQEVSDPNLEQNLENNKFHIIEKTTTSGAKLQKTIYKNGN